MKHIETGVGVRRVRRSTVDGYLHDSVHDSLFLVLGPPLLCNPARGAGRSKWMTVMSLPVAVRGKGGARAAHTKETRHNYKRGETQNTVHQ